MSFNDPIDKKQGAVKSSEIFMDKSLEIIKNAEGETALKTAELMMKPLSDMLRKSNFILHSDGQIVWTGTEIEFDTDSKENHIILKLMLMDEGAPKTVDLYLEASTVDNDIALFKNLPLADQELLYIELDRDKILSATSPNPGVEPARLYIENNVNGGSITPGAQLKKVSLSDTDGMPEMLSTESGSTKSSTMNIPLVTRLDWSDGVTTFSDIWWIPHGIRWPENTKSAIGAVVVSGLETLPSLFVRTLGELTNAITFLAPTGGIMLLQENILVDIAIQIPSGVTLMARTNLNVGPLQASPTLTVVSGGSISMETRSKIANINIEGAVNFGQSFEEALVLVNGDNCEIRDASFRLNNTSGGKAIAVKFTGNHNRAWNCKFRLGTPEVFRVGVQYDAGVGNIDIDSVFAV